MPRKNMPPKAADLAAADSAPNEVAAPSSAETASEAKPKHGTLGALVKELLMDANLSYAEIVARVMAAHPQANTSTRSVASTAAGLRKGGTEVPKRHSRAAA